MSAISAVRQYKEYVIQQDINLVQRRAEHLKAEERHIHGEQAKNEVDRVRRNRELERTHGQNVDRTA
jgi:hypothetical protein